MQRQGDWKQRTSQQWRAQCQQQRQRQYHPRQELWWLRGQHWTQQQNGSCPPPPQWLMWSKTTAPGRTYGPWPHWRRRCNRRRMRCVYKGHWERAHEAESATRHTTSGTERGSGWRCARGAVIQRTIQSTWPGTQVTRWSLSTSTAG